jgi:hypothetical protein
MKTHLKYSILACFSLPLVTVPMITGNISGTVADPTGHAVPGAKVTLTSQNTKRNRSALSNVSVDFSFVAVQPHEYSTKVEQVA